MNKNKFITGKKAVALLSAIGVTATLLSPLALNTKVFANDETPQIASRTPGDARYYSNENIIDFNDYKNDMNALQNKIVSFLDEYGIYVDVSIINVPEGTTIDLSNLKVNKDPLDEDFDIEESLNLYVNGDENTASYIIHNLSVSKLKSTSVYIPKLEEFVNIDKDYIKGLMADNVNFITLSTKSFSNQLIDNNWGTYIDINTKYLTPFGFNNFLYEITYTDSIGLSSNGFKNEYSPETIILSVAENKINSVEIWADCFADGTTGNNNYENELFITFDASDPNIEETIDKEIEEQLKTNPNMNTLPHYVHYSKNENVQAALIKAVQKYNLKFEISVYDLAIYGVKYTLSFDTITEVKDFNPYMEFKKVNYGDDLAFEFDFAHSGTLPSPMTVRMFVGPEYNTKTAYLYYKNSEGKLEKQASNAKVERGYAEFVIDHCSTYVVSLEEIEGAIDNTQSTTPESDTEISTTPSVDSTTETDSNNNSSTGSTTGDSSTSGNTTTKEDTTVNLTNQDSPSTGDTTKTTVLLSTMVLAGVVIVTFVLRKKVKRS